MTHHVKFPCPVRRIEILWSRGAYTIEGETKIPRMTLPKSLEPAGGMCAGCWFEARDSDGNTLYRFEMEDPSCHEVRVFDEDGSISQESIAADEADFEVRIPDLPEIVELCFFSAEHGEGAEAARAGREIEPMAVLKLTHS